ncbi:FkbM family methyltransferase [Enterobacter sp. MF024]|uniref:FkbM family methyltransferase n=1 Tax=Enterobacter sp. MF024 TaxID=2555644 RepID=UPI001107120F|nr:FkbM family methyltransferase [Enterobacter sp. MF024]TLU69424.1 FkbM family methyltransferase [Enterobacter sp. MF024]
MSLLNLLTEKNNYFFDTLQRMQNNGNPLVLYGAGCLGEMTWNFLARQNIQLDYVALNRAYISVGADFHDIPVIAIEDLIANKTAFNGIVALQHVTPELSATLSEAACEVLIYDPAFIGVNTNLWYTPEFCEENSEVLNQFYEQLADEKSKRTLVAFLNQRLSAKRGPYHSVYEPKHYFPLDVVQLEEGEVFVDCGAYDGDSINAFMQEFEAQGFVQPENIIGFEPDVDNFNKLVANTAYIKSCLCVNKGVWHEEARLYFQSGLALSSRLSDEAAAGESIALTSIDNILQGKKATFIKMDVEGAELNALRGAEITIREHSPVLAISVYHKPEDLITIPQFVQSVNAGYKFYLRAHHPELAFELVFYAIPEDRWVGKS